MQPEKPKKIENLTPKLAKDLILEQFVDWANLPVTPVAKSSMDNRTFRLGDTLSIRLPTAEPYALAVEKEQQWLPKLAKHLPVPIPSPVGMGKPCEKYPFKWSVYQWLEGEDSDTLSESDKRTFAQEIGLFLKALHQIDTVGGPKAGLHNYYRGASPKTYDEGTQEALRMLEDHIDTKAATAVWEQALLSEWPHVPVWIHGDFASGNILVKDGRLAAVIDFGCIGIGDPACDLVIAWTFLKGEAREAFKKAIGLDAQTWERARGWALWKALITLTSIEDKTTSEALEQKRIINDVISEHLSNRTATSR